MSYMHTFGMSFDESINLKSNDDNCGQDFNMLLPNLDTILSAEQTFSIDGTILYQDNLTLPQKTTFTDYSPSSIDVYWPINLDTIKTNTSPLQLATSNPSFAPCPQYGQSTPLSSTAIVFEEANHSALPENLFKNASSNHASASSWNGQGNPQPSTSQTRKTQRRQRLETKEMQEVNERQKFLERNRMAASKCRQRKKKLTAGLDEKVKELHHKREVLSSLAASLREEVLFLKGEMLRHCSCNCLEIGEYLWQQRVKLTGRGFGCAHY